MMSAQLRDPPHHRGGKAIPPSPVPTFFAHPHPPGSPGSDGASRGYCRPSGRFLMPWVTSLGGLA